MRSFKNGICLVTAVTSVVLWCSVAAGQSRGGIGACCLPDGSCQESSEGGCTKDGGQWQGSGSTCPGSAPGRGDVTCEPFGPPNARCEDAIALTIDVPTQGTVDGAFVQNPEVCSLKRGVGPVGVWYRVVGNGNRLSATICGRDEVSADARGGDSFLVVYCSGCDPLICVDSDVTSLGVCPGRGINPQVDWCSEAGREYYIFVSLEGSPLQDFQIVVDDLLQTCNAEPCGIENDDCENAIAIMTLDKPIFGTTENALSDDVPQCAELPNRSRGFFPNGVWYSVIGTGSLMSADLCVPLQRGQEVPFEGLLQVFCGDCDELRCVAGDFGVLQACDLRGGVDVRWCSEVGREYLILVALEDANGGRGLDPFFLLTIDDSQKSCDAEPCGLPNDDCENAIMLPTNEQFVRGSVDGATDDDVDPCITGIAQGGPSGVWYKVIGTGNVLEIDICGIEPDAPRSDVDGFAAVFCGSCENLQCVDAHQGGLEFCPEPAGNESVRSSGFLQWCSEEGREYYILVDILSQLVDEFQIRVRDTNFNACEPVTCAIEQEDFCEDAQAICPFITYEGHTFDATSAYFDHGGTIDTIFFCGLVFGVYDVWYKYTPAEHGLLFVHVEGPPTDFVFGVYDDCDEATGNLLACNVAYHHGVVVWPVQAYETYYIRIAGRNFTRGDFELDLVAPPCANGMETAVLTE